MRARDFVLFASSFAIFSMFKIFLSPIQLSTISTLQNKVAEPSESRQPTRIAKILLQQRKESSAAATAARLFSITTFPSGLGAPNTETRSDYFPTSAKEKWNISQPKVTVPIAQKAMRPLQQPPITSNRVSSQIESTNSKLSYLPHLLTYTDIDRQQHEFQRQLATCGSSSPRNTSSQVDLLLGSNNSLTLISAYSQLLTTYASWHRRVSQRSPSDPCVNFLSWTCSETSGLGDRMRGILHAAMLAIETKRYLVLNPPRGFPLGDFLVPNQITWYSRDIPRNNLTSLDFWRVPNMLKPDIANVHDIGGFQAMHGQYSNVEISSRGFPHFEPLVGTQWYKHNCRPPKLRRCHYLGPKNLAINRLIHDAFFRFTPSAVKRARGVAAQHSLHDYIAVHARIGGKLDPLRGRFEKFNVDLDKTALRLLQCVKIGMSRFGITRRPIYLATDDEKFRVVFAKHASNFTSRLILSSIKPIHSKVLRRSRGGRNAIDELDRKVFSDTVTETLVLGGARLIVTTGSGMSNYAAITGNAHLLTMSDCKSG